MVIDLTGGNDVQKFLDALMYKTERITKIGEKIEEVYSLNENPKAFSEAFISILANRKLLYNFIVSKTKDIPEEEKVTTNESLNDGLKGYMEKGGKEGLLEFSTYSILHVLKTFSWEEEMLAIVDCIERIKTPEGRIVFFSHLIAKLDQFASMVLNTTTSIIEEGMVQ
jgi:hypothetical protein